MALKFKFKSKEEIPADLLPLYTERDGHRLLDVDVAVEKTKLEQARALLAEKRKREEEKLLKGGDDAAAREEAQWQERERIEKGIESRVEGVKGELERQVFNLTGERDALTARLTAIQIDQAGRVHSAATTARSSLRMRSRTGSRARA